MNEPSFWIVRITLDAYDVCVGTRRVGATENTVKRLRKVAEGDYGVFYVSTCELHKSSQTISELRTIFVFDGAVEAIPIEVSTLPSDKSLKCSMPIKIIDNKGKCKILDIADRLKFIKKKKYWGSYLMQPFVNIPKSDYDQIVNSLGDKPF